MTKEIKVNPEELRKISKELSKEYDQLRTLNSEFEEKLSLFENEKSDMVEFCRVTHSDISIILKSIIEQNGEVLDEFAKMAALNYEELEDGICKSLKGNS